MHTVVATAVNTRATRGGTGVCGRSVDPPLISKLHSRSRSRCRRRVVSISVLRWGCEHDLHMGCEVDLDLNISRRGRSKRK